MPDPWSQLIGSAQTGLVGPYAFAPQLMSERRGALQKTSRRRARHVQRLSGQDFGGQPLYVEAVRPPLKALRHLLMQLAEVVQIHQRWDIGFEALHALFPGPGGEAWIDWANGSALEACPRDGTRWLMLKWRRWFARRYAQLQQRALANGRFFPPPAVLRVRTSPTGPLRVELGLAKGYVPGDRLFVLAVPLGGGGGSAYLLDANEPLPARPGVQDLLHAAAARWQEPGETVAQIGSVFILDPRAAHTLREGDALELRPDPGGWMVCAQGQRVGTVWGSGQALYEIVQGGAEVRLRVIRLHFLCHDMAGQVAFAAYRAAPSPRPSRAAQPGSG